MENRIIPCLWFESEAADAMQLYQSIFPDSEVRSTPQSVTGRLGGVPFLALNGRPEAIKPNPSISFMVTCEAREEIDAIWAKLSDGGKTYMELGSYEWSDYYGWVADKYGFTWQLYLGNLADVHQQRILPTLMFCGKQQGNCEQALGFYEGLFADFKTDGIMRYPEGEFKGQVVHAQFEIADFAMAAMDSGVTQDFTFNESISLSVMCADQAEIDHYWNGFTHGGAELPCGWCRDRYGVHWQVVPHHISWLLTDSPNAQKAFDAMLKMKKLIIEELENA